MSFKDGISMEEKWDRDKDSNMMLNKMTSYIRNLGNVILENLGVETG